jgi:hypothetical protein
MRATALLWAILLCGCHDSSSSSDMAVGADLSALVTALEITSGMMPKMLVGETQGFACKATYNSGAMLDASAQASWTSSDPTVASFSGSLAKALKSGNTMVTAQLGSITTAPVPLVVRAVTSITLSWPGGGATPTVAQAATLQLTATAHLSDGDSLDVSAASTWTSSDTAVVKTIAGGLAVPGTSTGTSTITASFSGQMASVSLQVTP